MLILQVRNFSFRPDTGRISSVQYDELGLASIPETWVTLWEVGVEHVHTVEQKRLTLRQRSSFAPLQLQQGSVGKLLALSLVRKQIMCLAGVTSCPCVPLQAYAA